MMARKRIVIEIDNAIVNEIQKRAKGAGVTITTYMRELMFNHLMAKDEVNTTEMIRQIKTNPLIWRAIRASLNRALMLNTKQDNGNGNDEGEEEIAKMAKSLGLSVEEYKKKSKEYSSG